MSDTTNFKVFVINLDHRKDRMESLEVPFEFERFPATNGSQFSFEGSKRMRGHLGCWDSHRRVIEKAYYEKYPRVLVLEDDCKFTIEDIHELNKYFDELPEDWDLLYLGGINQDAPEQFSEHLDYAKNILQTHAYIVRDKFIPTLLQTLTNHRWKIDIVFSEAIKRGRCFICNPPVAIQRESYSDINRH